VKGGGGTVGGEDKVGSGGERGAVDSEQDGNYHVLSPTVQQHLMNCHECIRFAYTKCM
jgi:hypothetical protein